MEIEDYSGEKEAPDEMVGGLVEAKEGSDACAFLHLMEFWQWLGLAVAECVVRYL